MLYNWSTLDIVISLHFLPKYWDYRQALSHSSDFK